MGMGEMIDKRLYPQASTICRRCRRVLTNEESIKEGIGKHCKTLERQERKRASDRKNYKLFGENNAQ